MIHTANEFTKTHHRHLLSGISPGLHALPPGCLTEPAAAPARSTRAATAAAHHPSTPPAAQSPRASGAELPPSALGAGARGMQQSMSLGALIDVNPLQGNPADALLGHAQLRAGEPVFDESLFRTGSTGVAASSGGAVPTSQAGPSTSSAGHGMSPMPASSSSMDLNMAGDLLGMPLMPGEYNVKDIDAVYFGQGVDNDLEDWSSFLEVPDFMTTFANSQGAGPSALPSNVAFEQPLVSVRDPKLGMGDQGLGMGGLPAGASSPQQSGGSPAPDCVVPEVPAFKKQRV